MHGRSFLIVVGLVVVVSARVAAQLEKEISETPVSVEEVRQWANAEWELTRLVHQGDVQALPSEEKITLRFLPNFRVAGQGPVNRFFGGFQLPAPGNFVWSGALGSTKVGGADEAMKLEAAFLEALGEATRVVRLGEKLVFRDDKREMILEWRRAAEKRD